MLECLIAAMGEWSVQRSDDRMGSKERFGEPWQ